MALHTVDVGALARFIRRRCVAEALQRKYPTIAVCLQAPSSSNSVLSGGVAGGDEGDVDRPGVVEETDDVDVGGWLS